MSGDIDIEEHDLMENPKIRTIFPDLTLLKKEIWDPSHEGNGTTYQLNTTSVCEKVQSLACNSIKQEKELCIENSIHNEIDLKLSSRTNESILISNKIILGSKPSRHWHDKKLDYEVKIFLKDINNYLMKSKRYCMFCCILFPKRYLLDHHTSISHNTCKNDTPSGVNRHKFVTDNQVLEINNLINSEGISKTQVNSINNCFHCNIFFPSQDLLIDHLYEVLEKKQARMSKNVNTSLESSKIVSENPRSHMLRRYDTRGHQIKSTENNTSKRKCANDRDYETISEEDTNFKIVTGKEMPFKTKDVIEGNWETVNIDDNNCDSNISEIRELCDIKSDEVFQCIICSYYFHQQKFYEIHMLQKHDVKVKIRNIVKFTPKCKYCSGIIPGVKQYNAHLHKKHSEMIIKKHNTSGISSRIEEVDQLYENNNDKNEVNHVENKLKTNKGSTPVAKNIENLANIDLLTSASLMYFKTFLFKCLKCDVHFLTPSLATKHFIHNEMLINWKCSVCNIFLKKNDEAAHLKQHIYNNLFTIYTLDSTDLNRILIKCSKCPLHILYENFACHLNVCENNIQPIHCLICNIMIDENFKGAHDAIHIDRSNKVSDFIIIDETNSNITKKTTTHDLNTQIDELERDITSECDDYSTDDSDAFYPLINLKTKDSKYKDIERKKVATKNYHHRTQIDELEKYMFTEFDENSTNDAEASYPKINLKTRDSKHKAVKRKSDATPNFKSRKTESTAWKRPKMCDYSFENNIFYSKFNSKVKIQAMISLNLTYCHFCECFISRHYKLDVHRQKRCVHILKRVCKLCGLVFTSKAINSHKEFHELNSGLKLQDFTFYDMLTNQIILPPIPQYPKCDICDIHFINKMEVTRHVCNEINFSHCDICDLKFSDETLNLHIAFHGYYLKKSSAKGTVIESNCAKENVIESDCAKESVIESNCAKESVIESNCAKERIELNPPEPAKQVQSESEGQSEMEAEDLPITRNSNSEVDVVILFTCEHCNVTVNSYDQLIGHCHSHYDDTYKSIETKECDECNLIFEDSFISSHSQLHLCGVTRESFKIFVFDIFHFGCSNDKWLQHVFKDLSEDKVKEIIKDSIYRYEYRIKLKITQQGSTELTLYQCVKCSIFIDVCDIFKHRTICGGKNKKYPCPSCGIPLLSTALRNQHFKIHERYNISVKSYRIAIFNRVQDKIINNAMYMRTNNYVLHQCRICNGVVDGKLLKAHKCDVEDLKKCNYCGLLIYNIGYDKHISRHKTLDTFTNSNMKVVLFGQTTIEHEERNDRASFFNGIVCDYTFYKCIKCDVCIQHLRMSSKHFCLIDAGKWKCSRCDLFFDGKKMKGHCAMHASDIEFTRDTVCVIPFDPQETYDRLEKEIQYRNKTRTGMLYENRQEENTADSIQEKSDVLYKSPCGLHYLSEKSAKEHVAKGKCQSVCLKKIAIQTCSKCNLNFTSETLFKHLLKHHGDKNVKYTFDIVAVSEELQEQKGCDSLICNVDIV